MYGWDDLKPRIAVTEREVECPALGCRIVVPRQRNSFRRAPEFRCPIHGIYISPSTWEYECEQDNLLWHDVADLAQLAAIKRVKRECRMARDNSEDAVTWNLFRALERAQALPSFVEALLGERAQETRPVYWSYDARCASPWPWLTVARAEFGERADQGSEPDFILDMPHAVIFIEAKVNATNNTVPSNPRYSLPFYRAGGEGWYDKVFASSPETVAIQSRLYELMRFWLLGSWIAAQSGRAFHLVSLVLDRRDRDLQERFGQHIRPKASRAYQRITWEECCQFIDAGGPAVAERQRLLRYMEQKTAGYVNGVLQRAFDLSRR